VFRRKNTEITERKGSMVREGLEISSFMIESPMEFSNFGVGVEGL